MRATIFFLLLAGGLISSSKIFSQRPDWRSRIDDKVREADSLSLKFQSIFYLNKFLDKQKPIKETWYYTSNEGRVLIFEIKYVHNQTEHSEIYYLDKNDLICMEEYEVPYLSVYADEVKKGGAFFFLNNNLKEYVLTGKQDLSSFQLTSTGSQLLSKFDKRYKELREMLTLRK